MTAAINALQHRDPGSAELAVQLIEVAFEEFDKYESSSGLSQSELECTPAHKIRTELQELGEQLDQLTG